MNIFLLSQRSTKIQLDMHLTNEQEIELENRYDFKVYFSDDGKHCKGVLNTEVRHKADPGAFYLFIEKEGIFQCEGMKDELDRKRVHAFAYTQLFPYVQALAADLAVSAGLPPIIIPMDKIDVESVIVDK